MKTRLHSKGSRALFSHSSCDKGDLGMRKRALEYCDVSFSYKKESEHVNLLESLNLSVFDGEFISIIGKSGSGKTTLFRLITGLEQPSKGDIYINGEILSDRFGQVGYMAQQDLLMPWRSIRDNAALPLEIQGVPTKRAWQQVEKWLKEFGLSGYENHYPRSLSGGMRQRVSFLRAMLSGSNVLLLDEPFSALDAITKLSMQEWLLNQWEKWQQTILFITHDVEEALFLSDRIFILMNKPVQKIEEIDMPLARPRDLHDLNDAYMIDLKNQLIDRLRQRESL